MHVQGNDRLKHPSKSVPQSSAVPDEPVNLRPGTLLQINLEHVRKELNVKVRLIDQEDHWLIRQIGHSNLANDSVRIYSYQLVFASGIRVEINPVLQLDLSHQTDKDAMLEYVSGWA